MKFETPESWIDYPLELTRQPFKQGGEKGTDQEKYHVEGHYWVTIETLLKTVMYWEVILQVPDDFIDRSFYQVYVQIKTSKEDEEPFYESFHFTMLYRAEDGGEITDNNVWIFSFCDNTVFSEIDDGNYQIVSRNTKKCTAIPAYIFDAKQSRVEKDQATGSSQLKVYFSRSLMQRGMHDLYVNTELNYRVGFNVYGGA